LPRLAVEYPLLLCLLSRIPFGYPRIPIIWFCSRGYPRELFRTSNQLLYALKLSQS
jgi:hypothetical protein